MPEEIKISLSPVMAWAVMAMIGILGLNLPDESERISFVAVIPSMMGMDTSISTRSKVLSLSASTASLPFSTARDFMTAFLEDNSGRHPVCKIVLSQKNVVVDILDFHGNRLFGGGDENWIMFLYRELNYESCSFALFAFHRHIAAH